MSFSAVLADRQSDAGGMTTLPSTDPWYGSQSLSIEQDCNES